jgi:ATP-dependent exoDNAse (exonuclease V) alpha subunit
LQDSARQGVVLVDEASLLGTRDMGRLFDVTERIGARIILVGDRKQHRSVAAGEPLKLLEERAGLPVAEVNEIMRQSGDYLKATKALSEGRIEDGLAELDKLGWIKEASDAERYQQLAAAYMAAVKEKKRGDEYKSALVVSPTHAEAARITQSIRDALHAQGKLGGERTVAAWVPAHLTDAEKADGGFEAGTMLQFHQHAPGHKSGSRIVVSEREKLPLEYAKRFQVYRPVNLDIAAGDRVRITANGTTKDGHRLSNGALYTLKGFTAKGDLILDNNWVIAKDWGHISLGYCVTSHTSQGKTVDKVFIGLSSQSFPATSQRTAYVAITRAREQAVLFTDQMKELLKVVERPDEPLSATEFSANYRRRPKLNERLRKHLASMRRLWNYGHEPARAGREPTRSRQEERYYER